MQKHKRNEQGQINKGKEREENDRMAEEKDALYMKALFHFFYKSA